MAGFFEGLRLSDQSGEVIDPQTDSPDNHLTLSRAQNIRNGSMARNEHKLCGEKLESALLPLGHVLRIINLAALQVLCREEDPTATDKKSMSIKPLADAYIADLRYGVYMDAVDASYLEGRPGRTAMWRVFSIADRHLRDRYSLGDGFDDAILDEGAPGEARNVMHSALVGVYQCYLEGTTPSVLPLQQDDMPVMERRS